MPEHLPMFGTLDLERYPISVRVSENCHDYPETFVAVMAHELSHVLLRSLRHPQRESELHTDLVPILLGFRRVVERGRKRVRIVVDAGMTTTRTTTYGYLSDSQFALACDKVKAVLDHHHSERDHLFMLVGQMRAGFRRATITLERFQDYLRYVDEHSTKRMKRDDAARVVQFHTLDYTREWENSIAPARAALDRAEAFAKPLVHYTNLTVQQLSECTRALELASEEIGQLIGVIERDLRILRRYVGLVHRFRVVVWSRTRRGEPHTRE